MAFYRTTILLLALSLPAHAATLFVSPDGTGVDGLTWETAFPTIGEAIIASSTGDEIWVKSATYMENLVVEKPLTVLGGFKGTETLDQRESRDPETNETVVDGNQNGSSVFNIARTSVTIQGFTIQHGIATEGSALRIEGATVSLDDLCVRNNGGPSGARSGGGISLRNSTCEIHHSNFLNNSAEFGGGLSVAYSTLMISTSSFVGNSANQGGGLILSTGTHLEVDSCVFTENVAIEERWDVGSGGVQDRFGGQGGAVYCGALNEETTLIVRSSIFDRNTFQGGGGGTAFYGKGQFSVRLENCTCVIGSETSGILVFRFSSLPVLRNCIVVSEPNASATPIGADQAIVSYSLVEGGYPGEGNIDADPKFVDIEGGDYHLQRGSPCIDSGTDTGLTEDFDGSPRPIGRYDMGAFEFPLLRSDLNGDGEVDFTDLMILQSDWGKESEP